MNIPNPGQNAVTGKRCPCAKIERKSLQPTGAQGDKNLGLSISPGDQTEKALRNRGAGET